MKQINSPVGVKLYGKAIADYVDIAEKPVLILLGLIMAVYLASFWLEMSYYNLIVPLIFLIQVLYAVGIAYWRGVMKSESWQQVAILAIMVGVAAGFVSSLMALVRFWHFWLIFNIVAEPVRSGLLAMVISLLTLGFFNLPRWLGPLATKFKK